MWPLSARFPVCRTFIALEVLALLFFVTGIVSEGPRATGEVKRERPPHHKTDRATDLMGRLSDLRGGRVVVFLPQLDRRGLVTHFMSFTTSSRIALAQRS
jgi:hypothetical protein